MKNICVISFLAMSLFACNRQAAIDDYIAAGMPPEIANGGIMIIGIKKEAPSEPVDQDVSSNCQ